MERQSAAEVLKTLQSEINARLRAVHVDDYGREGRELATALKQQLVAVRSDMREHAAAETADERQQRAGILEARLEELEQQLLMASGLGIFGPADTAITSALTRQLMAQY